MSITIKCNNIPRELHSYGDIPEPERHYFDYIEESEHFDMRFFNYRGSWYDYYEFERTGNELAALGFDGVQGESYFSAVVIRYFDRDGNAYDYGDSVVVGYAHW